MKRSLVYWENNCIGCDYCMGCGADHQAILVCDCCKEEVDNLYEYDGEQLCGKCVLERLPEVDIYE